MTSARPIQIWQPRGDRWERPRQSPFGDHYAAERTLPRRVGPTRRLVLVGESVAAGYLYAPHYTPAIALQARLAKWDVIDLARTNESLESLAATIDQALQLEPDVIVMWAGNNWMLRDLGHLSPYHVHSTTRSSLGQILDKEGPVAVTGFAERLVSEHVRPRLDAIADQLVASAIKLVVVVPEVNLTEWEHDQPVTVLPDGAESLWHRARLVGNHEEMMRLDEGSCAATHRLAAAGASNDARMSSYRQEVTAACGPLRGCASSPMVTDHIQDLLGQWTVDRGISAIDVRAIIAADRSEPNSWFLDYCHHTASAIDTIISRVATVVDSGHQGGPIDVDPELSAVAELGALMHTDHRLIAAADRLPLLKRRADEARRAWPDAPRLARDLIESRLGEAPVPLTNAQRRNLDRPYPFGFAHGWRPHTTEAEALTALGLTDGDIEQLSIAKERSWPIDQLWKPGLLRWTDEQPGSRTIGYFRSIRPRAQFGILLRPQRSTEIVLTARVREPGMVTLQLGAWEVTVELGATWTTHRVSIDPDVAPPGLHPLIVTWPQLSEGAHRWKAVVADLKAERVPDLHPVFGEVHSLIAH